MKRLIIALISVAIVTLLLAGIVYAYETLWSGEANITIEAPATTGSGNLMIKGASASAGGSWNANTKTWTVSIQRGASTHLKVNLENTGTDVITYLPYINGEELETYIADGVRIQTTGDLSSLAAGETGYITFTIDALAEAEPGTISNVTLEIR